MKDCVGVHYELRHGESKQNGGPLFYGGGSDTGPDGPVELTPLGEHQPEVASYAATSLGLEIAEVRHSSLERARRTATIFAVDQGLTKRMTELANFHEINHGSLQDDMPRALKGTANMYREKTVAAFCSALGRAGLRDAQLLGEYAGWVAPTGRGDGETYLEAGIRGYRAVDPFSDRKKTAFVGHNGLMRQMRVLGTSLTAAQRQELAEEYEYALTTHRDGEQDAAQQIAAFREAHGKEPSLEQLSVLLAPLAEASVPIVRRLGQLGIPAIGDILGDMRRIGNGVIAEIGVRKDGRWVRGRLITPVIKNGIVGFDVAHDEQHSWV